jgi:putative ABC transport system substrate-binding protein
MSAKMQRREFITVLGGAAAASSIGLPRVARAQQSDRMRRIGVLVGTGGYTGQSIATGLVQGLGALNWHEGRNLRIDWRWTGGEAAVYERYATELVALGPDVLVAQGSLTIEALRRQTKTIPIVFTIVVDPVGQGFVASLARPGGNITGFSSYDPQMAGKWVEMLTQITPPVARMAALFDPVTAPYASLMQREIDEAARKLAVATRAAPCRDNAEIEAMMEELARGERGGLILLPGTFGVRHTDAIVALAARHRLPAAYPTREFVAAGGLMSYGVDNDDLSRRAADYVDRILKGAKPADLPVQRPTRFELLVNLKTAKALGLDVPVTLLATADEVIE